MLKLLSTNDSEFNLDDVIRQGAKQLLATALEAEVNEYIEAHRDIVDSNGHRQVVRNGKGTPRKVTLGVGTVEVEAPRVNDRRDGIKFCSSILPPYLRRSPKIESLLPILYLRGMSTTKISDTMNEFFDDPNMGLSPSTICKLTKSWQEDFSKWKKQKISKKYVYIWADGVNVKLRLGDDKKICLLVIMGVDVSGRKELLAVQEGYRESKESWLVVLRSLIDRGFTAPLVASGDGALGFWSALSELEEFKDTKPQRCWVHKIANVLDKLPKRVQSEVKSLLHEMMNAPDRESAEKSRDKMTRIYSDKYPKAVECLTKDWKSLTTFFDFPAAHWRNIRSTNAIESSFATVKLRTKTTKGAGSAKMAAALAFKLLQECEKKWIRLRKSEEISNLIKGVVYKDGIIYDKNLHGQEAASM